MIKWYQKCMPTIKNIKSSMSETILLLQDIKEIKEIYAWRDYYKFYNKPKHRIKNVDIIAKVDICSGDLLAIDNNILESNNSDQKLEEDGYNPIAINFSKKFVKSNNHNIVYWTISNDNLLLHWGPIPSNTEDIKEIEKEAENHAEILTGNNIKKLDKSSEIIRKNWYNHYKQYINKYFFNMPSGWYQLEDEKVKNILKNSIKLL